MTDHIDRFSAVLFVFQLIAAPTGGLLFGLIAGELFDQASGTRHHQFAPWFFYALVGFVQGYLTQTIFRRADRSGGRLVWFPPVCLIAVFVLRDGRGLGTAIGQFLIWNPYSFTQGGASTILSMPAFACCFYSLGIAMASRSRRGTQGAT